ncbi:MAG: hypothetical protein VCD33_06225 [Alphaproteobacteria bacterium]
MINTNFLIGSDEVAAALEALDTEDAVSLPLLNDHERRRLLAAAANAEYRPARLVVGRGDSIVRQEMDVCVDFATDSPFHGFARRFQALVGAAADRLEHNPFSGPLCLDDLVLQRYEPGALGITAHRDSLRYINLTALFTLAGESRFALCQDRSGRASRDIDAVPGTVILLRAPGYRGIDRRPFHLVSDIRSRRYSFGLRQICL